VGTEQLRDDDPVEIGSFRLLGRIGHGGMGVVYLAVGPDDRRAALKVARSELADDPGFRQRFAREAAAASQVHSSVTAAVLAADPTAKKPWIAFEYIDAPNLFELVSRGVPRLSTSLGIVAGVAEALVAIHAVQLVHRDLKPANVLVARGGAVVIDFGVASALGATSLTVSGAVVGTPAWLAPEQVRGEPVTYATDSFAWGLLAMYTTTGRHPYGPPEQSPAAYMYRIVNEPPDLEGLPPELYCTVSAALVRDPARRPLAHDLFRALLPGGSLAPPTVPVEAGTATVPVHPGTKARARAPVVATSPAPSTVRARPPERREVRARPGEGRAPARDRAPAAPPPPPTVKMPSKPAGQKRRVVRDLWTSCWAVFAVAAVASVVGAPVLAFTMHQGLNDSYWAQSFHILVQVAARTTVPAFLATVVFDVYAVHRGMTRLSLRAAPWWHRGALLVAAVLPPAIAGSLYWSQWETRRLWRVVLVDPPQWFWWVAPVAMTAVHVACLLVRSVTERRR
jgi:hypothetical protein